MALSFDRVRGVFILYRGMVGMGGEVPTIIGVDPIGGNRSRPGRWIGR